MTQSRWLAKGPGNRQPQRETDMHTKILLFLVQFVVGALALGAEQLPVEVKETAGIQRFSYPVSAELSLPKSEKELHFRLLDGERELRVQVTALDPGDATRPARWGLDFNIDLLPNQTRSLTLEAGPQLEATASGSRGLTVKRDKGALSVKHPTLEFVVPENLTGLLSGVRIGDDELLVAGASSAVIHLKDGTQLPLAAGPASGRDSSMRVIKSGPLAATVACAAQDDAAAKAGIQSVLQWDFPLGKSWARVDWTVVDPRNLVRGVEAQFQLRLEPTASEPVLADVGAGGWTYSALRAEEAMAYLAGPSGAPWKVTRRLGGCEVPYVVQSSNGSSARGDGWAHLMDGKRCVAIAVDGFGEKNRDTIELSAQGHLRLARECGEAAEADRDQKHFAFWLHFVKTPPQVGAVTSPQSMQWPPVVTVRPAAASK